MIHRRTSIRIILCALLGILCSCASKLPTVPYPAFEQAGEIPDSFLAGLPGTRAKVLSGDSQSRRGSMLLQLPADWSFGTGAALDKTLELYLLEGDLTLGDFPLEPGGYAYLPSGSLGTKMSSRSGALLLYFLDDVHPDAVIQTPIINNSNLLEWQSEWDQVDSFGIATKELRLDPGSGARTWLQMIEPGAVQDWRNATTVQEGYLVSGQYHHVECISGQAVGGEYTKGGYFLRPAGAVNGGPDTAATESTVWLMRVPRHVRFAGGLSCGLNAEP